MAQVWAIRDGLRMCKVNSHNTMVTNNVADPYPLIPDPALRGKSLMTQEFKNFTVEKIKFFVKICSVLLLCFAFIRTSKLQEKPLAL